MKTQDRENDGTNEGRSTVDDLPTGVKTTRGGGGETTTTVTVEGRLQRTEIRAHVRHVTHTRTRRGGKRITTSTTKEERREKDAYQRHTRSRTKASEVCIDDEKDVHKRIIGREFGLRRAVASIDSRGRADDDTFPRWSKRSAYDV